jgi:hypothetical protein
VRGEGQPAEETTDGDVQCNYSPFKSF